MYFIEIIYIFKLFNLLNFMSENFIFVYIGVTMLTFSNHKWEISFIIWSLVIIILFFGKN